MGRRAGEDQVDKRISCLPEFNQTQSQPLGREEILRLPNSGIDHDENRRGIERRPGES
jgi:hypothetical protein